jgi:hypothetical protein
MEKDLRHCLPDRIRAIVGLMAGSAGCAAIAPLIDDGCRCAARHPCPLGEACHGIHRAFRAETPGNA